MNSSPKKLFLLIFFSSVCSVCIYGSATDMSKLASEHTPAYIRQYKIIAQQEMQRVGIPASIKMAQAILESASGRSTLARQSNNHFGIKCGKSWDGGEVYRHDDDYKDGLLVRSCFRAYEDPAESFIAHSNFLTDNRRYASLFDLDIYDYKGWAKGLRKAGYATDPKYPSKLIGIIEEYELYLLDLGIDQDEEVIAYVDHEEVTYSKTENQKDQASTTKRKDDFKPARLRDQSKNTSTSKRERKKSKSKSKRKTSSSSKKERRTGTHVVAVGERMSDIASKYKMPLRDLYFKNRLAYGTTPKVGSVLHIEKHIHFGKRPEVDIAGASPRDAYLFEERISISSL